jgi:hypothetical protein
MRGTLTAEREVGTAMIRWLLGGLIGGAIGIVIWVVVGYFTHYEVGWIAWVVGFLTGVGVRYAAYLRGEDASSAKGILASLMAIGAIFTAKFLVFTLLVGGRGDENLHNLASQVRFDDEAMIADIASDIALEAVKRGKTIAWPSGVSPETASGRNDFPPSIWQQAQTRWNQLGPKGQQEQKRQRLMLAQTLSELGRRPSFGEFFTPWDLLWFGLAVVTAYKVGAGTYGND